jgi:hypothetical protein
MRRTKPVMRNTSGRPHSRAVSLRRASAAFVVGALLMGARHAKADEAIAASAVDTRGADGLRADLERLVSTEEDNGWFLDRVHIENVYNTLIQSVCRATVAARREARAQLLTELYAIGDPRELYAIDKERSSRVNKALHLQRMHDALDRAMTGAEKECPFWVEPKVGFDGRQTDRNRFTLSLESGGLFQLRRQGGVGGYGGGAGLRVLPGYGFGRFTLLGGIEMAGGAITNIDGPTQLVITYMPAVPVILRINDNNWHYDIEIAGVSLFQNGNMSLSYGGRVGFGIGLAALRTRFFIPWAGVAIAYEHYFENQARPAAHFIRGGLRIGFMWDP